MVSLGYRCIHRRRPARCINDRSYRYDDRCDPPDTDKDGIFDPQDKCVEEPEDRDGFQDDDGCPDPDNDQDGLLDGRINVPMTPVIRTASRMKMDAPKRTMTKTDFGRGRPRPNEAETKNGFDDEDGCPEPDDDNDSYQMPTSLSAEPEDKDGFEDRDGCPDHNDGDGILDQNDLCPNEPENKNGVRDEDGCPDEILAVKTDSEIVITDEIHWKTDKSFHVRKV